jgi:hypothetical protein
LPLAAMPHCLALVRPMLFVLALTAASACDWSSCTNDLESQLVAPDGSHHAVVFQRSCGATTGFSTQVSVLNGAGPTRSANLPAKVGNAFIADRATGASSAKPDIELVWQNSQRLLIRHHPSARVFTEPTTVNGVQVAYESSDVLAHGG